MGRTKAVEVDPRNGRAGRSGLGDRRRSGGRYRGRRGLVRISLGLLLQPLGGLVPVASRRFAGTGRSFGRLTGYLPIRAPPPRAPARAPAGARARGCRGRSP